jgi:hypothetical protein
MAREVTFAEALDVLAKLAGRRVAVLVLSDDGVAPIAVIRGRVGALSMSSEAEGDVRTGVAFVPLLDGPEPFEPNGKTGLNLAADRFSGGVRDVFPSDLILRFGALSIEFRSEL